MIIFRFLFCEFISNTVCLIYIFIFEETLFSWGIIFLIIWLMTWLNSLYSSHRKFQLLIHIFKCLTWFNSILMLTVSHCKLIVDFIFSLRIILLFNLHIIIEFLFGSIHSFSCLLRDYHDYIFFLILYFFLFICLIKTDMMVKLRYLHNFGAIIHN